MRYHEQCVERELCIVLTVLLMQGPVEVAMPLWVSHTDGDCAEQDTQYTAAKVSTRQAHQHG